LFLRLLPLGSRFQNVSHKVYAGLPGNFVLRASAFVQRFSKRNDRKRLLSLPIDVHGLEVVLALLLIGEYNYCVLFKSILFADRYS
jgi:hypothetical protein